MKAYDINFVIWCSVTSTILIVGFFSQFFLGEDNEYEEVAEKIILEEFKVDIDFSPGEE